MRPELKANPSDGGALIDGFEFWWIGAESPGAVPNSGVQSILQETDTPPKGPGCFDCWVSEYLDNDRWGQVGFSTCSTPAGPAFVSTFYQVWDTSIPPGTLLIDGETEVVAPGLHTYAMKLQDGAPGNTTWEYSVDGNVFGLIDMGSATSSLPHAIATLCEEGDGVTEPFAPNPISVPVAMSVIQNGVWSGVPAGAVYNSAGLSDVVGALQDGSLANNAVRIGGDAGTDDPGTPLWSAASAGFAPDAGPAGATPLAPPLMTLTSPASGSTFSGTVTLSGTFAAGSQPLSQIVFYVQDGEGNNQQEFPLTGPPYTASWDTTQEPNEVFYVGFLSVDTLGRQTYANVSVTVDNRAGGTTSGGGSTSGGASTTGTATGSSTAAGGTTGSGSGSGGSTGTSGGVPQGTSGGVPQGTIGGVPTSGSGAHGCSSTGDLGASFAALIAIAWLLRRRSQEPTSQKAPPLRS